jgi:uncharacterized RmlC-like cupin family protein
MDNRTCSVVRGGSYRGARGGTFAEGISSRTVGARAICLHRLLLPPATRGRPHLHAGHESAIYIQTGEVEIWHGDGFEKRLLLTAGDYLHIPPGTPHMPVNTGFEDMIALVARTDPDEQEGVILLGLPDWLEHRLRAVSVAATV